MHNYAWSGIVTLLSVCDRDVPDSGSHPVPAGFGTIRFGPELPDLGPTGSELLPPKQWTYVD